MKLFGAERSCPPGIVFRFKQKIILKGRFPMSSPWDPAIPQAMQRHGGSNRSIPRTQFKPVLKESPDDIAAPQGQGQAHDQVHGQGQVQVQVQEKFGTPGQPETPAAA
jgi:hypothetical protein